MSRANYNNNPGNLRPPKGVTYDGQIGIDEKGFAIFENKDFGQRALVNDVTYKLNHGINTPDKFVDRFAPAGDENSEESRSNYKIHLAEQLGLKSTNDPFPKDAASRLAHAVSTFEGGTWNKTDNGTRLGSQGTSDITGASEDIKPFLGIVGGAGGATTAAGLETAKKVIPLVPTVVSKITGNAINPSAPMSRYGLQNYLNSQIAPNLRLPLSELEKVSGAGKIRTMSEVQNALKSIQTVQSQRIAKTASIDPKTGQPKKIYTTIPGKEAVNLSKYETKAGPLRQVVGRELQTAGEIGRSALPSFGRIAVGGLGGANAVMSGYDAWEMAQKLKAQNDPSWVDWARLATKTAATVGGGLSVLPFGVTQAAGLALQAPEMAWGAYDFYKNRPESEPLQTSSEDGLQNYLNSETVIAP